MALLSQEDVVSMEEDCLLGIPPANTLPSPPPTLPPRPPTPPTPPTLPAAARGRSAPPPPSVLEPPRSEGELGKFLQIITTTHKNCCWSHIMILYFHSFAERNIRKLTEEVEGFKRRERERERERCLWELRERQWREESEVQVSKSHLH